MINAGSAGYELVHHMHALHGYLSEAARRGDLVMELADMTIAVDRGTGPETLEFLLVAGEPMIWLRVSAVNVELIGSVAGKLEHLTLDVPGHALAAVRSHRW